jgi:hypothetical protein
MVVSGEGATLAAKRPIDKADPGHVETIALTKGQLRAYLTTAAVTSSGRRSPSAYSIRAGKDGHGETARRFRPPLPTRIELILP